ncbi:signal peptidase I [Tissierella sp.]|uniref:signal peptidase I n=1 Tax=Tissierella sp. TaxID=41274 RepID=UPI00286209A9|nr:signal peptidase I [Tissierella sp.]MDR7857877.1 signal peptidase I [Tissierella sp.]
MLKKDFPISEFDCSRVKTKKQDKGINKRYGGNNMNFSSKVKDKIAEANKREWIESLIIIIVGIFINTFIFSITAVSGESMAPTLEDGDRLLLRKYKVVLNTEEYNRGDIVVFRSPLEDDSRAFVKRVIGVPGDKINILEGKLYINDEYIKETYVESKSFTESLLYGVNYIVPKDEVFVIGDNRLPRGSNDSRSFGSVSMEEIKGKVVFKIFPFNRMGKDF